MNVLDHTCEGLQKFHDASEEAVCIPGIGEDGMIHGCDDSNPVLITHCPFCGTPLATNRN